MRSCPHPRLLGRDESFRAARVAHVESLDALADTVSPTSSNAVGLGACASLRISSITLATFGPPTMA